MTRRSGDPPFSHPLLLSDTAPYIGPHILDDTGSVCCCVLSLYRPECGDLYTVRTAHCAKRRAIGELAGVKPDLMKMWVDDLGSMLHRDEGPNGGIRVRHLSISDFFMSDDGHADYKVNLRDANVELGLACFEKMFEQLRLNICGFEDSRLANDDIKDLPSRIKENISDALQYSSLYWSNHVCFTLDTGDRRVGENLRKFFEGPYALFWVKVLSVMGMLRIGAPSLRELTSTLVKVST